MLDVEAANQWIRSKHVNDSTFTTALGGQFVYRLRAPKNNPPAKYLLYHFSDGNDVQGLGVVRLSTRPVFVVRTIQKGGLDASALAAAERSDVLLQNTSATVFDGYCFSARRLFPLSGELPPAPGTNDLWEFIGGLYRLDVSAA